ncbi:MAG TPA: DsrE family protein [Gaiellaceae bacterium]
MAGEDKVLINLATGMEDAERVLVAFLVATAAQAQGKQVVVWATKDAVRIGLPGVMSGVPCKECPPLERLLDQFLEADGEIWLCPICLKARDLDEAEKLPTAKVVGATPMWEWAGNDTTVFSY